MNTIFVPVVKIRELVATSCFARRVRWETFWKIAEASSLLVLQLAAAFTFFGRALELLNSKILVEFLQSAAQIFVLFAGALCVN